MRIKVRAWDINRKKLLSWEELLAGKEFKAKMRNPEAFGLKLMMATGLKDGYGHEIYEGDVLINLHSAEWAIVGYARGSFIAYNHMNYERLASFIVGGKVRIDECVFDPPPPNRCGYRGGSKGTSWN